MFITTHSTFLLEQLNNLIAASGSSEKVADAIDPNSVAAHHMVVTENKPGSVLASLDIDPVDGIDLTEFVAAYETLYEEGFRYRRRTEPARTNGH